jgi:glycosyltransferase involved in cell wall biosynthesis
VDDGSADRTGAVAAGYDGVQVIRHDRNAGYGAAIKTGFGSAHGDYLAFLDADGTYPPEALPDLCKALVRTRVDLVIGSRLATGGGHMPGLRKLGNRIYARLVSWLTGHDVSDAASGMRVIRASAYPALLPLPDGLDFTPAMTTRALHEGLTLREVPIDYDERVGQSKLSVTRDGWRFLKTILRVAHVYNPLRLYGAAALLMLALAFLLGLQPLWYYLTVRRVEDWEIYRLLTILVLSVCGISLLTFGLFTNTVLSILSGREMHERTWLLGRRVQQWIVRHAPLAGFGLMAAAPVLNYDAIWQYLSTGRIYTHWSYVLTGAFLFLTGSQLVMLAALIRTVDEAARHLVATGRWRTEAAATRSEDP